MTGQGDMTGMSGEEMVALAKRYTLFDWQAQSSANPIPVERAEGVYFWTPEGKRYLDFNSQLMGVNIGHGDRRVVEAIKRQAEQLAYISPFMATGARARLGEKLAEILPGDMEKTFFTLGGAEANENAIRMARAVTPRLAELGLNAAKLEYDPSRGMAVITDGAYRVELGFGDQIDARLEAFEVILRYLQQSRTPAQLIDVRFLDRPYFR